MIKCECECETINVNFSDDSENILISVNNEDNDPIIVKLDSYTGAIDDYNLLINKPTIDGVTLEGNLTSEDLGLVKSYDELNDRPSLDGITITGDMSYTDFGLVKSYDELSNRPSIDGVTLTGDMTSADLGLVKSYDELTDRPILNGNTIEGSNTNESLGIVLSDTFENWSAKSDLISGAGTVYVYTDYHTIDDDGTEVTYPGVKIGDGHTTIGSLSFINSPDPRVSNHISNTTIHVTSSDKDSWNTALSDIATIKSQMTGAMHNIGETTTNLSDGSTTRPIRINGINVYPSPGDVTRNGDKEFMYAENNTWVELGSLGAKVFRGSTEYWRNRRYLIAARDVIYIYTDYKIIENGDGTTTVIQGMKIGDGTSFLIDMPFIGDGGSGGGIDITQEDIDRWNNKWAGYMNPSNPENLVFII